MLSGGRRLQVKIEYPIPNIETQVSTTNQYSLFNIRYWIFNSPVLATHYRRNDARSELDLKHRKPHGFGRLTHPRIERSERDIVTAFTEKHRRREMQCIRRAYGSWEGL